MIGVKRHFLLSISKWVSFRWTYSTASELNGRGVWGQIADYEGGGYVQSLGSTKNESLKIIKDLKVRTFFMKT